jgi:hypothetical protein
MAIEWVEVKAQRGDDVREMTNLQDAFWCFGKDGGTVGQNKAWRFVSDRLALFGYISLAPVSVSGEVYAH